MSILWETDATTAENLRLVLGDGMRVVDSGPVAARRLAEDRRESLLVVGAEIDLTAALSVAEQLRMERPDVGVVLLRRRLDVTVLAQALRSGVREVVSSDDLATLTEACQRSRELSRRLGSLSDATPSHQGRVVTVFAAKGGVGKTTVSTNLAAELATSGAKVLLVDLDLAFGDVAITLGLLPERTTADLVPMSGHLDEHGLASVVTSHDSGLDALCAPASPADAERIPGPLVTELIRTARRMYDFVLIDTPPAFTEHVLAAFDASDLSILIATLDIPAVKNLRLTLDTLDLLGHPRESEVIVLNRSDAKVGLTAGDVATALNRPIAVQVPNSSAVPAAINRGVAIVLDAPRHPVSAAVKALARDHVRPPLADSEAEPHFPTGRASRRSGAGIATRRFLRRSEA
jgi:pilus assembly protein CpaE